MIFSIYLNRRVFVMFSTVQKANEMADVNIVDIKWVCIEIVPAKIQKESISLLCIMEIIVNG